jgi:hypothetical protein
MLPLTLDDLLPLDEYAGRRREFFEAHRRYLDGYRRVRVGPRLALLFQNRQTLWFHVQEVLRVARLAEPSQVQQELDLYNRLLPGRGQLQAALLIDVADESRLTEELAFWQRLPEHSLRLTIADWHGPGQLTTCRPQDRCIGAAHWVRFVVEDIGRDRLADFRQTACFEVVHDTYRHASPPLSEDIRQSLLDDLELSDRDTAYKAAVV